MRSKTWRNKLVLLCGILSVHHLISVEVSALAFPNGPRLVGIIPPPQVLLPPHREEGQSLDDIIYGTSFSGGSFFPSPPTTSRPTSSFPALNSNFNSQQSTNQNQNQNNRARTNLNPVQTFVPPTPPPQARTFFTTSTTTTTTSRPLSFQPNSIFAPSSRQGSSSSGGSPSSAEEIKVPQALKLRSPHRKQYTKADLIAAANSLRPAGFDFNKLLAFTTPATSNFSKSGEGKGGASTSIYQNARFPLPLFDTPVFKELMRPLMEMIMKQQQQQQQKQQQLQQQQSKQNVRSGSSDNKKVLVIIPKASGSSNSVRSTSAPRGGATFTSGRQAKQLSFSPPPKSSTSRPAAKSTSRSNFVIVPKTAKPKLTTTRKPKSFAATTKRTSKLTEIPKKSSEKNPDLQASATSNKLSQQKSPGSKSSDIDKRSYSLKGADNYSFSYEVKNDAYGDVKSHSESRDGDQVAGEYSMLEADGYTRVVKYTVDSDQGFKASVKRIPPS